MPYSHPTLIDNGPALLGIRAASAGRIVERLLAAYTNGDSLATVTANTIATPISMVPGDFSISPGTSNSRVFTIAAKNHTLTSGVSSPAAPAPYRAFVDTTTGEVLFVGQSSSIGGGAPPWVPGGQVAISAVTVTLNQWT